MNGIFDGNSSGVPPSYDQFVGQIRQFSDNTLIHFRPNGARFRPYVEVGPTFQLLRLTNSKPSANSLLKFTIKDLGLIIGAYQLGSKPPLEGGGIFQFGLQYGAGFKYQISPRWFYRVDFRETLSAQPDYWTKSYKTIRNFSTVPGLTLHLVLLEVRPAAPATRFGGIWNLVLIFDRTLPTQRKVPLATNGVSAPGFHLDSGSHANENLKLGLDLSATMLALPYFGGLSRQTIRCLVARYLTSVLLIGLLATSCGSAQVKALKASPQAVPQVSGNFLEQTGAQPHFARFNKMPVGLISALRAAPVTGTTAASRTIPFFMGAFFFNGTSHPYFMAGNDPQRGNETRINTAVIPLNFFFDEWLDSNGKHISIKVASVLDKTLTSPNFVKSAYSNGFGQFGDAVQRAEFFSMMKDSWHTTLNRPRLLTPVTITVPFGQSQVFQLPDGSFMATLSADFFESQLSTILQLAGQKPQEFPMLLSKNVFLYSGDPANCCILGFHSAYDVSAAGHPAVQTFGWASWASEGIFSSFSDVTPLSHEISEWMNDPFVSNTVPAWQSPNGRDCQGKLSSGDPTEVFANSVFPITLHGFTYHPQNEALLPWFAREDPSSAFRGAYSYPDTSLLTEAAQDCAAE